MPGILNRALEGPKRLRQRGNFLIPADCERAKREFFAHANPLVAFIDERCDEEPDGRMYLREFRVALKEWAKDQGVKRPPADNRFKRKLEGLGYKVSMVNGYSQLFGLEWRKAA